MTTGKKIQRADYNAIRTKVIGVVGAGTDDGGYGYPLKSTAVTTTSRIRKSDWIDLGNDITNARRHQVGTPDPTLLDLAVGSKVKSNLTTQYYTRYDTLADQVVTDRNLVNATSTINITAVTREFANDEPWYNLITATVTVEFDSEDNARSYFNAGGEIRFSSSRTDPSGVNPDVDRARQNTSWSTLLTNITNGTGGYTIPRFGARLPSAGITPTNGENYYRLTGVYQQWYTASPPTTAPGTQLPDFGVNDFVIKARFPDTNNRALIEFRVEWQDNFQADYKFDDGITGQFSLGVTLIKPISFALAGFDGSFSEIETPEVVINEISDTADTEPAEPDPPSYSFTQDLTSINETPGGIGNVVTYTINTTNVVDGAVLYWRIFGTATASDFDPQTLTGSASVTNPYPDPAGTATIAITARSDATSEAATSPENFTLRVYDTEAGRNADTITSRVVNASPVTINDTSKGTPTIAVTVLAGSETISDNAEVDEGTDITYNLATTNIDNAASISFSFSGQATTADYTPATSSGTIPHNSSDGGYTGTSQLQSKLVEDLSPFQSPLVSGAEPDPETMTVTFSYPGAVSAVRTIRIRDTSFQPAPQPTVTGAQWSPGSVYIGNSSTLSYTANNVSKADAILSGGSVFNTTNAPPASTTINFSQSFTTGTGSFTNTGTYSTTIRGYSYFQPGTTIDTSSFNLQVLSVPTPQVNSVSFSPASYTAPGSSTLSWATTGANYVSISLPSYSGNYDANGSFVVNYSSGGTYTATVTPRNGPQPGFPAALTPQTYTGPSSSNFLTVSTTTPPPPPPFTLALDWGSPGFVTSTGANVIVRGSATSTSGPFNTSGFSALTKHWRKASSGDANGKVTTAPLRVTCSSGSGTFTISSVGNNTRSADSSTTWSDGQPVTARLWAGFNPFTATSFPANASITTSLSYSISSGGSRTVPLFVKGDTVGKFTGGNVAVFRISWNDNGTPRTQNVTAELYFRYDNIAWGEEAYVMWPTVMGDAPGSFNVFDILTGINAVKPYYHGGATYSTSFGTRYGLRRHADVAGTAYWSWHARTYGQPVGSVDFNSSFFNGMTGSDLSRSTTASKPFLNSPLAIFGSQTGAWWDRLS